MWFLLHTFNVVCFSFFFFFKWCNILIIFFASADYENGLRLINLEGSYHFGPDICFCSEIFVIAYHL